MTAASAPVPPVFRLLAEPVRWRLLRELAAGDRRVRELTAALDQPQNLISYHLRQLRSAGLVAARRSSFDARDSYYRLDLDGCAAALSGSVSALHPGLAALLGGPPGPAGPRPGQLRVLFVCTGNAGRSPMAAALLRDLAGEAVSAASAGITPSHCTRTRSRCCGTATGSTSAATSQRRSTRSPASGSTT